MEALGISTPLQMLFVAIEIALNCFFPERYGFGATNLSSYHFLFLFGSNQTITDRDDTEVDEILFPTLSVMDSRFRGSRLGPRRGYPFDRCIYSPDAVVSWLKAYLQALDGALTWLCDLSNFRRTSSPKEVDTDFAIQSFLTFYMIMVNTLRVLVNRDAYERKVGLFALLDLHSSLITTAASRQTIAWKHLVSIAFARDVLAPNLDGFPEPFCTDLKVQLCDLRSNALRFFEEGIVYPSLMVNGMVPVDPKSPSRVEDFECDVLRELRNTKHGYAIQRYQALKWHTGNIHNDLPDYALVLFLNLLLDRTTYTLARS